MGESKAKQTPEQKEQTPKKSADKSQKTSKAASKSPRKTAHKPTSKHTNKPASKPTNNHSDKHSKAKAKSQDTKRFIDKSVEFLRKQSKKKEAQKLIIGLSGGVDSAVVAALCQKAVGKNVLLVFMPSSSTSARSIEDVIGFVKHFKMELEHIDISAYEEVFKEQNPSATPLQIGNFCARIRMAILYNFASAQKGIVVGTSNKSELMLGYGTIYGDMACAINPIASLSKTEVFTLAKALNVPESIIKKPPTADLYEGQSDEGELGFSYEKIDALLEAICEKYGDFRKTKNYKKIKKKHFKKFDKALVEMVCARVKQNLFKREAPRPFVPKDKKD